MRDFSLALGRGNCYYLSYKRLVRQHVEVLGLGLGLGSGLGSGLGLGLARAVALLEGEGDVLACGAPHGTRCRCRVGVAPP